MSGDEREQIALARLLETMGRADALFDELEEIFVAVNNAPMPEPGQFQVCRVDAMCGGARKAAARARTSIFERQAYLEARRLADVQSPPPPSVEVTPPRVRLAVVRGRGDQRGERGAVFGAFTGRGQGESR